MWFDSGTSHEAVLAVRPELQWPADMYLEGSDQYRGWFHSSLLVALGTRGEAPYRSVITHGFVVDEDGRKMSKSRGNNVVPQQVIEQSGAEVLRLWVAMVDYTEEVRLGKQILARTVEAYRKIRNTVRYLAANLYDFDPATDLVAHAELLEVDRYALARYADAAVKMRAAYERFDFQTIFHELNRLAVVDLSAFYFDVSKDRLYTFGADVAGAALGADGDVPDGRRPGAPAGADPAGDRRRAVAGAAGHARGVGARRAVCRRRRGLAGRRAREPLRDATGDPRPGQREARGAAAGQGDRHVARGGRHARGHRPLRRRARPGSRRRARRVLHRQRGDRRCRRRADQPADSLVVTVARAAGEKCQRCWRYVPASAAAAATEGLCDRCVDALGLGSDAA